MSRKLVSILLMLVLTLAVIAPVGAIAENSNILGDINGDSSINGKDVLTLRKNIVGLPVDVFVTENADVNEDGNINGKDVLLLRKYIVGLDKLGAKVSMNGTINGNVYTNEYFDVTFTKPSGWEYYTKEELQDIGYDETVDMMVISADEMSNVGICITDLTETGEEGLTAEEGIEQFVEFYTEFGFEVSKVTSVKLGDVEYKSVTASLTVEDITVNQYIYLNVVGDGLIIIYATDVADNPNSFYEAMLS